jgi:hypothetical protein
MIEIDHICLGVQNVYEGSARLQAETGLANYEGGWFPSYGLANRIVPLAGDVYIEVEAVIDPFKLREKNPTAVWFDEQVTDGDVFIGWCARVSELSELERLAHRFDTPILDSVLRVRPDGTKTKALRVPDAASCWKAGLPNFFYFPDMAVHPARQPVTSAPATPLAAVSWMELGGTEQQMSDWLGVDATSLKLRFNGRAPGLYAVAIQTPSGEKVIHRPPVRDRSAS